MTDVRTLGTIKTQPVYGLPGARPRSGIVYDRIIRQMLPVHRWTFTETSSPFSDQVRQLVLAASGGVTAAASGPIGEGSAVILTTEPANYGKLTASTIGQCPVGSAARSVAIVWKPTSSTKECLTSWGPGGHQRQWWTLFQTELDAWSDDLSFDAAAAGSWHFIVATYDGNVTMRVLIDGILVGAHTLGGTLDTGTSPLQVGLSTNDDGQGSFTLDDLAIFDRVLTSGEISALLTSLQASPLWG